MAYELHKLSNPGNANANHLIDADELRRRVDELLGSRAARFRRLWTYYQNPMLSRPIDQDEQGSDRPYRQGQEWGLPSRVTGVRCGSDSSSTQVFGIARKEVVIENDIGWRIDTMVDFLFGKPISIGSLCSDPRCRAQIESLLSRIITLNGGHVLLQQIATLGAVHGFVDVLVKLNPHEPTVDGTQPSEGAVAGAKNNGDASLLPGAESASSLDESSNPQTGASFLPSFDASLQRIARMIRLEVVEPARALPVLSESDWRQVDAYAQVYQVRKSDGKRAPLRVAANRGILSRLFRLAATQSGARFSEDNHTTITEIITASAWQRYEDEKLIDEGQNSLGEIPLVHIQNLSVPFAYSGTSDVEQLMPLQDELNIRLCDRAHRITMQSFKMYLGKGIDGFTDLPVAPGRMWVTDNDSADVIEFGGDLSSPSEDQHIAELREAMDKVSAVSPIAAGVIRDRVGNLTSAAALRVTLMALLARTERKRTSYGGGIARMCELALAWLDRAGVFHTSPDERRVEIRWPGLLPDSEMDRLREAEIKRNLGVPSEELLRELGYEVTPSPSGRGQG